MTPARKLFCEEYLRNGYKALPAYEKAFPTKDGKPRKSKPSYPYTLLKEQEIQDYINQRRNEIFDSLQIDQQRVIQEVAEIAFAVKGDPDYPVGPKIKALELLSKLLGIQVQKTESENIIEIRLEDSEDGE